MRNQLEISENVPIIIRGLSEVIVKRYALNKRKTPIWTFLMSRYQLRLNLILSKK